jgi:hypothetical protein
MGEASEQGRSTLGDASCFALGVDSSSLLVKLSLHESALSQRSFTMFTLFFWSASLQRMRAGTWIHCVPRAFWTIHRLRSEKRRCSTALNLT